MRGSSNAPKIAHSNKNLLDNWDFTNPVNQRGKSNYSTISGSDRIDNYKYTIDKWQLMNGTLNLNDNSVRFTTSNNTDVSMLYQQLEPLLLKDIRGKRVTTSIKINGEVYHMINQIASIGTIYTSQIEITGSNNGQFKIDITYDATNSGGAVYAEFRVFSFSANSYIDIQAVKMEIGEVSTLKNDAIGVNYAEELRKCQYYYQRLYQVDIFNTIGSALVFSEGTAYCSYKLTVPMRQQPALVWSKASFLPGNFPDDVPISINNIAIDNYISESGIIRLRINTNPILSYSKYTVGFLTVVDGGYLAFSAEL